VDTVRQNAFDAGKRGLDESRTNAERDQKFALFAQGLNGGSVDIDQGATLGRTYDKGRFLAFLVKGAGEPPSRAAASYGPSGLVGTPTYVF
jgi:hypothetical protein